MLNSLLTGAHDLVKVNPEVEHSLYKKNQDIDMEGKVVQNKPSPLRDH